MTHPSDETINDFVDGALARTSAGPVERHLADCAPCAALASDLRRIAGAAAALPPLDPPARVWARLAPRLGRRSTGRDYLFGLAAAATLLLVTLVGLRYAGRLGGPSAPSGPAEPAASLAISIESELQEAEAHYQKAIDGLQQIAAADEQVLDPDTAATLRKNLAVIDQAISESRAALKADSRSVAAQASLLQGLRAKVALLQDAVTLINDQRPLTKG